MNGVWVYWLTDHMFGVSSRAVSKYALREGELEMRVRIAQSHKWMRKWERMRYSTLQRNQLEVLWISLKEASVYSIVI